MAINSNQDFDFENRIVDTNSSLSDIETELSLRPKSLEEYVGQEKVKENLRIFMKAAQKRGECLDHVLLHGPPGRLLCR